MSVAPKNRRPRQHSGSSAARGKVLALMLEDAPTRQMPRHIHVMLASLVAEPFDRAGWLFEVKWDGYRAIAEVDARGVSLYSRNHLSFNKRFAPVVESLRHFGHEAVLDGEVVVVDGAGKSDFELLQKYQKSGQGRLCYYVFDLLYLDGHDLRQLPLWRRKELLATAVAGLPDVVLSEHVEEHGVAFFKAAAAAGLEGIIAKDGQSPYREGQRSHAWLKIKTRLRQEAVICGFTEPRGSRQSLAMLVLGIYQGKQLTYIGHAGGGLDTQALADLRAHLAPHIRPSCPFPNRPRTNAPVHWVEPLPRLRGQLSAMDARWDHAPARLRRPAGGQSADSGKARASSIGPPSS